MKKNDIKKYYNQRINELRTHNKLYFDKSSPKILDKEYDEIKKEILDLENQFSYLKSNYSPSNLLGFAPSKNFIKSNHRVKMLSLSNAFDIEDLDNFDTWVTDDFYIFENSRKYSTSEFIEFVKSFDIIDSKRAFEDVKIETDHNSAHITLRQLGEFRVNTPAT